MSLADFSFKRFGRAWHPVIENSADLARVPELDEALWIATAAPVASLEADATFLRLVDTDGDGRIRADELRTAIRWLFSVFSDTWDVIPGSDVLKLSALKRGGRLFEAANGIAREVGSPDEITLAQVRTVQAEEAARGLSEAGKVLPVAAGADEALKSFLEHVIEVVGGASHPLGPAVTPEAVDRFMAEAAAWLSWKDGESAPAVHPLGDGTGAALAKTEALAAKFDQYFLLCDAVRLDPALADRCWPTGDAVDLLDAASAAAFLGRAPLMRPRADGLLDFSGAINPAYVEALRAFDTAVRKPLLGAGGATMNRDGLARIREILAPHAAWLASKPATAIGPRGVEAVRAHASDEGLKEGAKRLFGESVTSAAVFAAVGEVEKAILFQAYLLKLTNNFVSHPELYDLGKRAFYEMGTLVLDGRRFNLAVRVPDAARHEKFTSASAMFVMYVQVGARGGQWDYEVAVPVTAGERGNLAEGMWGVFTDNEGTERHAYVRKVIANPISIREAVIQPFYRAAASVQAMLDKQAEEADAAATSAVTDKATGAVGSALSAPGAAIKAANAPAASPAAPAAPAAAAAPPAAMGAGQIASLAAAGGIALAAIGQVLATISTAFWGGVFYVAEGFAGLPGVGAVLPQAAIHVLAVPLGLVLTAFAFVSAPLMFYVLPVAISTWFKLRRRDLAALLEGAGWALNTRMFLTADLAGLFTQKPTIPPSKMKM